MPAKEPTTYDPAKTYKVVMAKVVRLEDDMVLRPMHDYEMTGDMINRLPADAIKSATPIGDN